MFSQKLKLSDTLGHTSTVDVGAKSPPFPMTRHIAYITARSYRSSCDRWFRLSVV